MSAEVHDDELHAFLDGHLPSRRCTAVLAYLGRHPHEIERLAAYLPHKSSCGTESRNRIWIVAIPRGQLTLCLSSAPNDGGPEVEVVTLEGLTAGYWHEGELTSALVGDTSEQELVAIATLLGADRPQGSI